MIVPRNKFREAVFYAVFSWDFSCRDGGSCEEEISMFMEQLSMSKKNIREAREKAERVLKNKEMIDEVVQRHITDYDLHKISYVDRNILRLATYELLFDNEIPEVVAISEGIRLCRKFSTPESANFVNGVLDAIYKNEAQLISKS